MIGPAAMIGLAMLGGYGWLRDLRAKSEAFSAETGRRFGESEADRKDLRIKLDLLERDSVRRGEMKELKTEIIERVKEAEHTIRGGQAVTIGEMRDMVKALLERAFSNGERRS